MSLHLLQFEREDKTHVKCRMMHEDWKRINCAFVFCVRGQQNLEDLQIETHAAANAIMLGDKEGLGSVVYPRCIRHSLLYACSNLHAYWLLRQLIHSTFSKSPILFPLKLIPLWEWM